MADTNKIPSIEQMLPGYWGEPERWEEARTMALISQAKSLEIIAAGISLLTSEGLELLEEAIGELKAIKKALGPEELIEVLTAESEEPTRVIG